MGGQDGPDEMAQKPGGPEGARAQGQGTASPGEEQRTVEGRLGVI